MKLDTRHLNSGDLTLNAGVYKINTLRYAAGYSTLEDKIFRRLFFY